MFRDEVIRKSKLMKIGRSIGDVDGDIRWIIEVREEEKSCVYIYIFEFYDVWVDGFFYVWVVINFSYMG